MLKKGGPMLSREKVFVNLNIKYLSKNRYKPKKQWQEGFDIPIGKSGFTTKDLLGLGDYENITVAIKAETINKIGVQIKITKNKNNYFLRFVFRYRGKKKELESAAYNQYGLKEPSWAAFMVREV